jgi:hypothetical protein
MSIGGVSADGKPFKVSITALQSLSIEEVGAAPQSPHVDPMGARPPYAAIQTRSGDGLRVRRPEIFWMSEEDGDDWFSLGPHSEVPQRIDINRIAWIDFRHVEVRPTDYQIYEERVLTIHMKDGTMIEGRGDREWAIGGAVEEGVYIVPFDRINNVRFLDEK